MELPYYFQGATKSPALGRAMGRCKGMNYARERKLAAFKRNTGRKLLAAKAAAMFEQSAAAFAGIRRGEALRQEETLTGSEKELANQVFKQVFPELVRMKAGGGLEGAVTDVVAALRAGIIAIR